MKDSRIYKSIVILFCFITLCVFFGCNITEAIFSNSNTLTISLTDVSVTETYIRVQVSDPKANDFVVLQRNGKNLCRLEAKKDLFYTDTSLSQNSTYNYKAMLIHGGTITDLSNEISARTMVPTSHEILWKVYALGEAGCDDVNDVTIIDEHNIWVAGSFYQSDDDPKTDSNMVKWDGKKWKYDVWPQHEGEYVYNRLQSIWSFSPSDIWIGSLIPKHWNGENWRVYSSNDNYPLDPYAFWITGMWGASSSQMYFSGEGSLVKYDGHTWKKIFKGTANTGDLWGVKDPLTGEVSVYMAYFDYNVPENSKILKISGSTDKVESIAVDDHMMPYSLWTNKGFPLFTCSGWGLFSNKTGKWKKEPLIDSKFMNHIRGTAPNDIFVAGDYGFLAHWNGLTWKIYEEFSDNTGQLLKVAVKGNTIAAIGILRGSVVAIIGKRQFNSGPVVDE